MLAGRTDRVHSSPKPSINGWIAPHAESLMRTGTSQLPTKASRPSLCVQDLPKLEKQAKWTGSPKPSDNKWDATINEAIERGKEVPEIDWAEPGEAAAHKVLVLLLPDQAQWET